MEDEKPMGEWQLMEGTSVPVEEVASTGEIFTPWTTERFRHLRVQGAEEQGERWD